MRYAQNKGNHSYKLELHDLKALIAIFLIGGYVDLPRRPMFWECSADVHNDAVSSIIPRNRFDEIMKYLHLADNISLDPNDKFSKVRPLLDKLNEQCLPNYPPEQTVSIDESMVPYFGRHECNQFMKNKVVKFGYKLWVAAALLGYATEFYPYMGKDFFDSDLRLRGSVVDKLTNSLPKHAGSNYHIITDNFFTSPQLLRSLREKGIAATGTVRLNRVENVPLKPVKEMEKLERGSADVGIDDNAKIAFVRWKDNKVVTVLSSKYGLNPTAKIKRYIKEKKDRVDIEQPQCIKKYNKGMGGVNRLAQNIATYIIAHRSKKWWWSIFRFCVDLCANKAFQIYRHQKENSGQNPLYLLGFRRSIVDTYC